MGRFINALLICLLVVSSTDAGWRWHSLGGVRKPSSRNRTVTKARVTNQAIVKSVQIDEPQFLYSSSTETAVTCATCCDGMAEVVINGGTAPWQTTWSNGDSGEIINGLCSGSYTYTVIDANGCTTTGAVEIDQTNGIQGAGSKPVIYPNPAHDIVHIRLDYPMEVEVYDPIGKLVLAESGSSVYAMDFSHLSNGVYTVKIGSHVSRIVVQH